MRCWFAGRTDAGPCDGPIDKAHWVPKQRIKREFREVAKPQLDELIWHPSVWSPMCRRHHSAFDAKMLRIRREEVPLRAERWAAIFGMTWSLDADFGLHPEVGHTTNEVW
jgi:hypothetical protein